VHKSPVQQTLRMDNGNDLKSVETRSWFHTLITRSEENTALDLCEQFIWKHDHVSEWQDSTQKNHQI